MRGDRQILGIDPPPPVADMCQDLAAGARVLHGPRQGRPAHADPLEHARADPATNSSREDDAQADQSTKVAQETAAPARDMRVTAFYNEIDPYAAQWLRNLIVAGYIADGIVDERDIRDIRPDELSGFAQCHFFAGIGLWSLALRQAGVPDDSPVWTGSCPCQPFSSAGRGGGTADERHLWPAFFHHIDALRPPVVMGEQVASADGLAWLDLVSDDLEGAGYTVRAADTCAAGVGAPHIRQRLYWMANAASERRSGIDILLRSDARGRLEGHSPEAAWCSEAGRMADAGRWQLECQRPELASSARAREGQGEEWQRVRHDSRHGGAAIDQWSDHEWIACTDGKLRPVEPGLSTLVDGGTARVGKLRAYGNAICPQGAAETIRMLMGSFT